MYVHLIGLKNHFEHKPKAKKNNPHRNKLKVVTFHQRPRKSNLLGSCEHEVEGEIELDKVCLHPFMSNLLELSNY